MNTKIIGLIIGVLVIGVVGVVIANVMQPEIGGTALRITDDSNDVTRPAVQARENTFGIVTAEEKARLDAEKARKAALAASSSATSTASSTDEVAEEETASSSQSAD